MKSLVEICRQTNMKRSDMMGAIVTLTHCDKPATIHFVAGNTDRRTTHPAWSELGSFENYVECNRCGLVLYAFRPLKPPRGKWRWGQWSIYKEATK